MLSISVFSARGGFGVQPFTIIKNLLADFNPFSFKSIDYAAFQTFSMMLYFTQVVDHSLDGFIISVNTSGIFGEHEKKLVDNESLCE